MTYRVIERKGSASILAFMSLADVFPNVAGELEQLWDAGLCVLGTCLFKFGFASVASHINLLVQMFLLLLQPSTWF